MDEINYKEWEAIAAIKEAQRAQEVKEIERLERLASIPFHKRLQEEGEEDKLERIKQILQESFKKKASKEFNFEDYWNKFLEVGISLNDWLEAHNDR